MTDELLNAMEKRAQEATSHFPMTSSFLSPICQIVHCDVPELIAEIRRLRAAIAKHHAQFADDLCWMDDNELYAAAGLPPRDNTVGDPEAMLENCKRYVAHRCAGGGGWKSYAELTQEVEVLRRQLLPIGNSE